MATCEGCNKLLGPVEAYRWAVCLECTKARHRAVVAHKCVCGNKRRPSDVHRIGSRTWTGCFRCLGQIRQLS